MTRPRVASVFGTRPEAIKMAPVVQVLQADAELEHTLVVTAQHRALLDDVLALFQLAPDHDLRLMREYQSLHYLTGAALTGLAEVFAEIQPQFVLVHGDTTTTFAATLAAFYQGIPVGHVEAGLRTSNIARPFPEEFNRRATDLLALHHYCPTPAALANLAGTARSDGLALVTGNTVLDAVQLVRRDDFAFADAELAAYAAHPGPKLLLTAHRRENWGTPLRRICAALLTSLDRFPEARVCVCWHPNPVVRDAMRPLLAGHPRVLLTEPPPYDVFVNLLAQCDLVLSDSGGIQEEVTQLKRYCLVLRDETERPEAVAAEYARVIGTEEAAIIAAVREALPRCLAGELPARGPSPFGDGFAAQRIHQAVRYALGLAAQPPASYAAG